MTHTTFIYIFFMLWGHSLKTTINSIHCEMRQEKVYYSTILISIKSHFHINYQMISKAKSVIKPFWELMLYRMCIIICFSRKIYFREANCNLFILYARILLSVWPLTFNGSVLNWANPNYRCLFVFFYSRSIFRFSLDFCQYLLQP